MTFEQLALGKNLTPSDTKDKSTPNTNVITICGNMLHLGLFTCIYVCIICSIG